MPRNCSRPRRRSSKAILPRANAPSSSVRPEADTTPEWPLRGCDVGDVRHDPGGRQRPSNAGEASAADVNPSGPGASGVSGLAREHAEIDTEPPQRLVVFSAGIRPEDQLGIGRAMQPAVMLDL